MHERFYLPGPLDLPELTLAGPEAHHLAQVLRLGPGATVALFDGEGTEAVAEVTNVSKRAVTLRSRTTSVSPPPAVPVTLAVAPPKGDRLRWLVEKATELGVDRLAPLLTRRGVVDPREGKLDKLRQTVIAACKQCRRNRLMEIDETTPLDAVLRSARDAGSRLLLADPAGKPFTASGATPAGVTFLIGPEGGFTDDESAAAREAGASPVRIGRTILRVETAAVAAAALATMFETDG